MDEPTEDVAPPHPSRSADPSGRIRRRVGRPQVKPAVRAFRVVVRHGLTKHPLQVTATNHERPVEAFAPNGPHPALGEGIRLRGSKRGEHDADAVGREDGVEAPRVLGVAVADQEPERPRSDRSQERLRERLRAFWVTHAVSGCLVAAAAWTCLVQTSMTKHTSSVRSHAVSTVKQVGRQDALAWLRRNWLHVGPDRRGAGPRPWRRSSVRMAVAETSPQAWRALP